MLSYTFINSHSQVRVPGPDGVMPYSTSFLSMQNCLKRNSWIHISYTGIYIIKFYFEYNQLILCEVWPSFNLLSLERLDGFI